MLNQQKYIVLSGAKEYFISTWKTDNTSVGSSTDHQVKLPFVATGSYDCVVYWGDGKNDKITVWNQSEITHTYSDIGTYEIKIYGKCEGWQFNDSGDKLKILTVEHWGKTFKLNVNGAHFFGCANLVMYATDELDIGTSTNLAQSFRACTGLTTNPIKFKDTSKVTTCWAMFYGCNSFNGNLSTLTTQSCVYFNDMFGECHEFNQPVNHFDSSNVTSMYAMFYACAKFNQPVSNWITTSLTNMISLFNGCTVFDQSVSNFDTSGCSDMYAVFNGCTKFNQSVSNFDTSSVTNMTYMFRDCALFNQSVSNFDTSLVQTMVGTFYGCTVFNQSLSAWNTNNVTDMYSFLRNCAAFDQDISNFNIEAVTNVTYFLDGATSWSTSNYDAFLIEIATNQDVVNSLTFHCSSTYTLGGAAAAARADLIATDLWTINDLGGV